MKRGRMMDHDLIVVGGGAAGLGAVRAALRAGADVALVTDEAPGGDCTFTGCVPSKTLLAAARDGLSFTDAMTRVRSTVEHIAATESADVLRSRGVTVIEGRARLVTHDTVAVGERRITARRIVVATGSQPSLPDYIPGLVEARPLTNETVFDLTDAPESLGIIGGGPTGCELAQAFALLGVEVTLFERWSQLLPSEEPEAAATVRAALQDCGVHVRRNISVAGVESLGDGGSGPYRVLRRHRRSGGLSDAVVVERLLVAAGRTPSTDGLGLEDMGMKLGPGGVILTDARLATSIKGVYAAGDVAAWPPPPTAAGHRFEDHLIEKGVIDTAGRLRARPDGERVQAALADLGIRTGTLVIPDIRFGVRARLAEARRRFEQRDRWHLHFSRPRRPGPRRRGHREFATTLPPRMRRIQQRQTLVRISPGRGRPRYTGLRSVLAAGPRAMLSHAADEMGRIAVGNALGKGLRGRFRASMVPRVVFTDPEVASVGVIPWHAPPGSRVAYLPLSEVDRAITDGRTDGFIAIVAGPRRLLRNVGGGRILGATIVAPRAGEMIQEVVLAMRTGAFAGRLAQASHAYPTWSSGVQKAAAQFFGEIEGRRARRVG
ncbi:MAG: SidA/IucD/PvdA family monooxygenase [Acidimicrobiaceae bacterium]|nr:SidA/IucD/PvdA family monooxygenase [Acidimicrobiaceae bacterium]MYL03492.1 SidA/IucD/PvdA family monooxygenase [Acidimicrobiaceae bacterium]